jgi:hypothetical protein
LEEIPFCVVEEIRDEVGRLQKEEKWPTRYGGPLAMQVRYIRENKTMRKDYIEEFR